MTTASRVPGARPEARPWRAHAEARTVLTVEEAAGLLRIGRNTCYELIRQHQIPHIRLGRVIRIPRFGLEQWIAREAGLPSPPPPVVDLAPSQRH